jgi:hypothetical protein
MLQAMKEEPPLAAKCKDKFLIQSTTITPEKETLSLSDIVSSPSLELPAICYSLADISISLLVSPQRSRLRDDDTVEHYRW